MFERHAIVKKVETFFILIKWPKLYSQKVYEGEQL
jgi:hypothetical protein